MSLICAALCSESFVISQRKNTLEMYLIGFCVIDIITVTLLGREMRKILDKNRNAGGFNHILVWSHEMELQKLIFRGHTSDL